ncbi:MAG TPA: carotenoid biosynthesis protein, partial [Nitrospirales bacterium]|nr:carotenoid biosynthesis protein [Nitrospirales bacterium]
YGYPDPGVYFGVPIANFVGWAVVGLIGLSGYFIVDRRTTEPLPTRIGTPRAILLGCGLYYGVLLFNLAVTFWIGERLLGLVGVMIFLPITALALLRVAGSRPGEPRIV